VLLDVADHQLYFEIVGIRLSDFIQPEKDRLQVFQHGHPVDLLVQILQLVQRIQVLAHDAILHYQGCAHEDDVHNAARTSARRGFQNLTRSPAIAKLAAIAPGLKTGTALRILVHLLATTEGTTTTETSTRDLAPAIAASRRNVQLALADLIAAGHLRAHATGAKEGKRYTLAFLEVEQIPKSSGVDSAPLPAVTGVDSAPAVASIQRPSGVDSTPLDPAGPGEGMPRDTRARIDLKPDKREILDRVFSTNVTRTIPRDVLQEFRRLVTHVAAKLHRAYDRPPDNESMARLVHACGSTQALHWLVIEMQKESRQPGDSPMWWVTVALQRIHGIDAKTQAIWRAQLKAARQPQLVTADTPTEEEELDSADLKAEILKLAFAKGGGLR